MLTPLNLNLLFDPRFDVLPPTILQSESQFVRVRSLNGRQIVRIPILMNGRLAYLVGVIIGDGYLSKAIKRKAHGGGYHWKLVVTGPRSFVTILRRMFLELFGVRGGLLQDRRKADSWQLRFSSLVLHRFFARVIGLPQCRKTQRGAWSRLGLVKEFPFHFLAGLIDSDGHVGAKYVGIVQKRLRFLLRIKRFAWRNAGLHFRGPYVNSRKNGKTICWIISIFKEDERLRLMQSISRLGPI